MSMHRLQPGQYFRNTDSQGCAQRIKAATKADLPELELALKRELGGAFRRKRLITKLSLRIAELRREK